MTWLLVQPILSPVGIGGTLGVLVVLVVAWGKVIEEWVECWKR